MLRYNLAELMNVVESSPRFLNVEIAQRIQQLIVAGLQCCSMG